MEEEEAAVVAEVEGDLVAVLDLCQLEACLVEECPNYDQWEVVLYGLLQRKLSVIFSTSNPMLLFC